MTNQNLLDSLSDAEILAISAAFPAFSDGPSPSSHRLLRRDDAPKPSGKPKESQKKEKEKEPSLFDGLAQLSGLLGSDERIISSLVGKPREVKPEDVRKDPSLLDEYLIYYAYSQAGKTLPKELEKQLGKLTIAGFEYLFGDESSPQATNGIMCPVPSADFFEDPLRWLEETWNDLQKKAEEKIDDFTEWENLAQLGVDKGLEFAADKLMESLGLDDLNDSDPASAHITQKLLKSYLMPEIKDYLKGQLLSLLKDQFPESLKDLKGKESLLERLKEAAGLESDAGCALIALQYDIGDHGGAITSPCATSVVAGDAEIALARKGDGFQCPVHLSSNPVKEGIENILVEGLPITAHKLHSTCGARIVGSAGHNVFVADSYPLVILPPNDTPACPVLPDPPALPATGGSPAASPEPVDVKPQKKTAEPEVTPAATQDSPEQKLTPEQREELQRRLGILSASIENSKEKLDEWLTAKQELEAVQAKLKWEEQSMAELRTYQRQNQDKLIADYLDPITGGQAANIPSGSFEGALVEANTSPMDKIIERERMMQEASTLGPYVKQRERELEELKDHASKVQEREDEAAADFSQAVRNTALTGGEVIFTPIDVPLPVIKDEPKL